MERSFEPLQIASRPRRLLVFVLGPLLWLVAIVVVAVVVDRTRAIEIGLLVSALAFVVALVVVSIGRQRRVREERSG